MAKSKKQHTIKSGVTMRFKSLVNGRQSIYLDIYKNGERRYEFLKDANGNKLVLYPDTPEFKKINDATMKLAKVAQSRVEIEVLNDEYINKNKKQFGKMLLLDWVQYCIKTEQDKKGKGKKNLARLMQDMYPTLENFVKPTTRLSDVDKQYCLDYIDYLRTAKVKCWADKLGKTSDEALDSRKTLSSATASLYFIAFGKCIKEAYKAGHISGNPVSLLDKDDKIKVEKPAPIYLKEEELRAFARVECQSATEQSIKNAFLFSCFTGYRYSDIKALMWKNLVIESNGDMKAEVHTIKTKKQVNNSVNGTAKQFLPERGNPNDLVFDLHYSVTMVEIVLNNLALRAGITKHITFHKARHTCATLMLTKGVAITTVQKVLGHSDLSMTQKYAHVIDEAVKEASNAININF